MGLKGYVLAGFYAPPLFQVSWLPPMFRMITLDCALHWYPYNVILFLLRNCQITFRRYFYIYIYIYTFSHCVLLSIVAVWQRRNKRILGRLNDGYVVGVCFCCRICWPISAFQTFRVTSACVRENARGRNTFASYVDPVCTRRQKDVRRQGSVSLSVDQSVSFRSILSD